MSVVNNSKYDNAVCPLLTTNCAPERKRMMLTAEIAAMFSLLFR